MKHEKLLIIHADDAGLCHSENRATIKALEFGCVNSYSIMVNCPWFYEIATFSRTHPQYDVGVHLTLTCEWESYKFGPVLPTSKVPSLVDDQGYFYKNRDLVRQNAVTEEVHKELTAQIERALSFGITPSHLDSHMYSVASRPDLFECYKALGRKYGLPVLINTQLMEMAGLNVNQNSFGKDVIVDKAHYGIFEYYKKGELQQYYENVLDDLVDGLNVILIHPAFDDAEMQAVTLNHPNFGAAWRQIDFDYFSSDAFREKLKQSNVKLVTWKDVGF
ncbi:polysaccharide deacetylase family protein [Maribacter sp. 2210JD10-5]|uniref:polysaccharide deacetylase family protein n=1 Tax=Maribacter sp. 2210JD10-5 TaxID=3386272 RepID=UPI0039BD2385